jgi:hypothetical protein
MDQLKKVNLSVVETIRLTCYMDVYMMIHVNKKLFKNLTYNTQVGLVKSIILQHYQWCLHSYKSRCAHMLIDVCKLQCLLNNQPKDNISVNCLALTPIGT